MTEYGTNRIQTWLQRRIVGAPGEFLLVCIAFVMLLGTTQKVNATEEAATVALTAIEVETSVQGVADGTVQVEASAFMEDPSDASSSPRWTVEGLTAEGWSLKTATEGSAFLPSPAKKNVQVGDLETLAWGFTSDTVLPGEVYSYTITETGTESKVVYDDSIYYLDVFIVYVEETDEVRAQTVLRKEGSDGKQERCTFENTKQDDEKPIPPTGHQDSSSGKKGVTQTSTYDRNTFFTKGSGEITKIQLIDPYTAQPTDAKVIDALDQSGKKIGTYTLQEDGSVRFTPDADFVGDPRPCGLVATDENGLTATASYQPHVTEDQNDPDPNDPEPNDPEPNDPDPSDPGTKEQDPKGQEQKGQDTEKNPASNLKPGKTAGNGSQFSLLNSIKTGDTFHALPYFLGLAGAVVVLVLILAARRKRHEEDEEE